MRYRCHGLSFESEFPLPLPRCAGTGNPDWRIYRESGAVPRKVRIRWDPGDSGDRAWLRTGRAGNHLHVEFPGLARFVVARRSRQIGCHPHPGVPGSSVAYLLMNQVVPFALAEGGQPMLHASAVAVPAGTVAFLGDTGTGKSTLAAALALQGCALVSEDAFRLEFRAGRVLCHPCPSPPRLWPDSFRNLFPEALATAEPAAHYTNKLRMTVEDAARIGFTQHPVALRTIFVLDPVDPHLSAGGIRVDSVSPHRAFEQMMRSLFRVRPHSNAQLEREFEWATTLARQIPFRRIRYPQTYSTLHAVGSVVIATVARVRKNV